MTRGTVTLVITSSSDEYRGMNRNVGGAHLTFVLYKQPGSSCVSRSVGSPRRTQVFGAIPQGKALLFWAAREAESQRREPPAQQWREPGRELLNKHGSLLPPSHYFFFFFFLRILFIVCIFKVFFIATRTALRTLPKKCHRFMSSHASRIWIVKKAKNTASSGTNCKS